MVEFETEGPGQTTQYPCKVLALYEGIDGKLMAFVHSVEYKTATNVESPFGDSRLVTHYRLQFLANGRPKLYSVPFDSIQHVILAFEAVKYDCPLVPQVRVRTERKQHTVMTVLPRREWANLFVEWTQELKDKHETETGDDKYKLR